MHGLFAGGPLLAALVSGEAAEAVEKVSAGEAVAEVMTVLRGIFEPQGIQVPTPLQVSHSLKPCLIVFQRPRSQLRQQYICEVSTCHRLWQYPRFFVEACCKRGES